jgi:hypothetical protein
MGAPNSASKLSLPTLGALCKFVDMHLAISTCTSRWGGLDAPGPLAVALPESTLAALAELPGVWPTLQGRQGQQAQPYEPGLFASVCPLTLTGHWRAPVL